jgi:hypothetical protein
MTLPTIKEWKACKSDEARWRFVIKYAPYIDMMLDNDCTMIKFGDDDQWMHFDGYIGWNECAVGLGAALGLRNCEPC